MIPRANYAFQVLDLCGPKTSSREHLIKWQVE